MSDIAIRVEGLSKRYRIGGRQEPYRTLRDTLAAVAAAPLRYARSALRRPGGESLDGDSSFWALHDVSFEIPRGEVVGIIGRNGAGKSTLLKILSRITEPTSGYADIYGRVGSLLEVGTGFHPELTGRENIYLNGAILGMKRTEIERKFDEIVAFAEIERFIDTPVKHYSSGMYLRLAFAVAAHLEPEILLVDEVLAVGDAAFQKKCLGKIGEVAQEGRTVLFVSHDLTNISVLCRTAILLAAGQVSKAGASASVIDFYLNQNTRSSSTAAWEPANAPGDETARIISVSASRRDLSQPDAFKLSETLLLTVEYAVLRDNVRINPVFVVKNQLGTSIFSTSNFEDVNWGSREYSCGRYRAECLVPAHLFNEGRYFVHTMVVQETRLVNASVENAISFSVYDDGTTRGDYVGDWVGIVRPRCTWSTEVA